jgi:hypothetical protein
MIVAFDIETAATWNEGDDSLDPKKGLGITCIGFATPGDGEGDPTVWARHSAIDIGEKRMNRGLARDALASLVKMQADGATIVTWNGLFDWHVLGVEAGDLETAARGCLNHVDLMLAFHAVQGYPLGLKAAAAAVGSHKGTDDVGSGAMAPDLWAVGEYEKVLEYVKQDAAATLDVALHLAELGRFTWQTRRGGYRRFILPRTVDGLKDMQVRDVIKWPEPDQSWQSTPLRRKDMIAWMDMG